MNTVTKDGRKAFPRRYQAALRKRLARVPGVKSQPAGRLGGQALSAGLGALDLARIHDRALIAVLASHDSSRAGNGIGRRAATFLAEALAPVEKNRRAMVLSNGRLNRVNETLSERTADLAAANRRLKQEIARRRVMEKALKRSEHHHQRLFEQSRRMQEQFRRLSHRILSAHEEERRQISRELHDEIGQSLTGVSVTLAALTREATVGTRELKHRIARTQQLVERSMTVVHRFARELRPGVLDDLGLIPALHSHMKEVAKRTRLRIRFRALAVVEQLDIEKRTVLYRVVQEALANVAKHARATRVSVSITRDVQGAICLKIHDNGRSFQVRRVLLAHRNKRLGLVGMRERVEMVGGRLTIESAAEKGTTIRAELPFTKSKAA